MKVWMGKGFVAGSVAFVLLGANLSVRAQSAPKPGLWEIQVTSTHVVDLPPEVQAKMASMPPAQQAMMQGMMGGGGKPVVTTKQVCFAAQTSMDSLLNQAQQSPGMQCTVSNRTQTASSASFDVSCTSATASAKGHTEFHMVDEDHVSSTSHVTVAGNSQGRTMNSTVDSTTSGKFVSADCGDVKPYAPPPAK